MEPDSGADAVSPTTKFKLRLLGFPAIAATDGSSLAGLGPGKPLALLAYLAVRGETRRDELVDLLWGEVNETNARNAFRQALHRLRTALGEELLPLDPDRVSLVPAGRLEADRDLLIAAIDRGDVAAAAELYRGDFLDGFEIGEPVFDSWVDAERTRLKGRFQQALQTGAATALTAGRWVEALQYIQRVTAIAPYDEGAALLEASILIAAGRSTEALVSLRRFVQILREQLDLPPGAKVRDMMGRLERSDTAVETRDIQASRPAKAAVKLVGREEELGRLMGLVRDLAGERGTTLLIEGPAGIGKTRLVSEVLGRAGSLGRLLVLRGRERPTGASLPYASVAEALRGALRAPGVAGTGRHLLAEAARILPELRDNFDLPEPASIDAEGGRLRFFEGIAAFLDSVAYEQPVCVVLDDMHNASVSTLELLSYLTARLAASPVLVLALYRDTSDSSATVGRLRALASDREASTAPDNHVLTLGALSTDDISALIEGVIRESGAQGQVDVDRLAAVAEGNPLRAIDLARRALNGELPSTTPTRLRDILWSRLQKASPSQRRVFFAAALIQRRCSLRLLAAAAHLPEIAAFEAAQNLEAGGLLAHEGDGYVLAHDFTAAFVSEASGLAGRALLAGWAADAMSESGESGTSADLAQLYSVAGQQAAAFTHARKAVYDAAALGSAPEIHRLLGLALALAPDTKSRQQVETMLAAFGAGKRLLETPGGIRVTVDDVTEPPGDDDGVAIPEERSDAALPISPAAPATPEARTPRRIFTERLVALISVGAIVVSVALVWRRSVDARATSRSLQDSLLVVERGKEHGATDLVVTGPLDDMSSARLGLISRSVLPAWVPALSLTWIRPSVAPHTGFVGIERMTDSGTDVYVMVGDSLSPIPIAVNGGFDVILGWSPDGRTLLVRRAHARADGAFDADLWSYRIGATRLVTATPIDTSSDRVVGDEAAWSPDGTRMAWVAQSGPTHQRDIFASRADGAHIENLSENPGEDYHIAWSSDGNLLAFTSDRDGNPDLFAIEFDQPAHRLWRLTNTPDEEDFATFSPDHRFVAFQSTRGGDAAVYIMPALGGVPSRVTPPGGQFSIAGWRGATVPTYVDRLRVLGPTTAGVGDSVTVSIFGADQDGVPQLPDDVPVRLIDPAAARLHAAASTGVNPHAFVLTGLRAGVVRVAASIPGWRDDTLAIQVGASASAGLSDDFADGLNVSRWISLGRPRATTRTGPNGPALFPNGDLQWQSGILSREVITLGDTVDASVTFDAPFSGRPLAAAMLNIALVAEQPDDSIDAVAPQLAEYVGVAWDGEASRFVYSVGRESKSDPISVVGAGESHVVRIAMDASGHVSFFIDGRIRWASSLRFLGGTADRRTRLWLGGRASGDWGSIRNLKVTKRTP